MDKQFKPFTPRKYTRNKLYIGTVGINSQFKELCSNCGFPWGQHFGIGAKCPTKEQIKQAPHSRTLKPVKHD